MSMLRPMRDELFKYRRRKRRSIDGSVAGVRCNSYRRSRRHVSGLPYVPRGPRHHHDLYNWDNLSEYHPNLNAPAVQAGEYESYEEQGFQQIPNNDPHLFRRLPDNIERIEDPIPTYEDTVIVSDFFFKDMELMYQAQRKEQGMPNLNEISQGHLDGNSDMESDFSLEIPNTHELPSLEEVTDVLDQLREVLPKDHPDIVRLETAAQVLDYQESMPQPENIEGNLETSGLGLYSTPQEFDPFQEAEQIFSQQMQSLENTFEEPTFEPVEMHAPEIFEGQPEMVFEQQPNEAFMGADSIEQIVEQEHFYETPPPEYMEQEMMPVEMESEMSMPSAVPELTAFDIDPAIDEINQAIDEALTMPQEMESDPFQPQYDPYMMNQNMFDEMQYMADPFAMPGPCGPMGPMPGP